MRSGFSSLRARLAGSVTALMGLSVMAGCETKQAPDPAPTTGGGAAYTPVTEPGPVTTLAIGEEEGSYGTPTSYEPMATTLAVGEEDGSGPFPVEPNGGIGDGAQPLYDGSNTTYEVGEEDNVEIFIPPEPGAVGGTPDYGQVTTLAIGEEG